MNVEGSRDIWVKIEVWKLTALALLHLELDVNIKNASSERRMTLNRGEG